MLHLIVIAVVIVLLIVIIKFKCLYNEYKQIGNNELEEVCEYEKEELPYKKKRFLFSKAENNFYKVLNIAIKDMDIYICPKVRLADIIYIEKTSKWQVYWNKIKSKHIDFLLCKDNYFNPLIAIELDDSSHYQNNRIERDYFLNKALESANLSLLRVKVAYTYNPNELKGKIEELLKENSNIIG